MGAGRLGMLVAIEGIDGTGKTELVRTVAARLRADGHEVVTLREPTTGPWGTRIRKAANATGGRPAASEELEWFILDRRDDVDKNIKPALAADKIVLIDRYYFSSMAYQGARGLDPEAIAARHRDWAPEPDVTIILTAPVAVCLQRIRQVPGRHRKGFEQAASLDAVQPPDPEADTLFRLIPSEQAYLEEVHRLYASFTHPSIRRVDAGRPAPVVSDEVFQIIRDRVTAHRPA